MQPPHRMCTITAFDPPPFDKLAASNALTEAGLDKHVADGIVHVTSGAISQLDKHRDEEWQTRRDSLKTDIRALEKLLEAKLEAQDSKLHLDVQHELTRADDKMEARRKRDKVQVYATVKTNKSLHNADIDELRSELTKFKLRMYGGAVTVTVTLLLTLLTLTVKLIDNDEEMLNMVSRLRMTKQSNSGTGTLASTGPTA